MSVACEDPAAHQVLQWVIAGNSDYDVLQAIMQRFPDRTPRQLLAAVMDHLWDAGQTDGGVLRGWCLEAYRELYRKMVDIGDYNNAAKVVKELHKMAA